MSNIKVNKLSDNLYHIYNVNSRKHYTFGKEEIFYCVYYFFQKTLKL